MLIYVIHVVLVLFAHFWGRTLPTQSVRRKVGEDAVRKAIEEHFVLNISGFPSRDWTCLEVIEDHSGPFGQPNRKVVLEDAGERIIVASLDRKIQPGTIVHLQLRPITTYPPCPESFVDKYVFAYADPDQPPQEI